MLGPETPSPRRSLSFRLKVTLLAVIAAVAPVIVVGWLVSTVNRTALDEVNRQLLDAAVVNVASNVRATLDDADATLSKIGSVLDEPAATRDPVVEVAIDLAKHVQGVAIYDDGGAQLTSLDGPRGRSIALPATLPAELRRDGFRSGEVRFVAGRAYMLRTFTLTRKRTLTVAAYVALSPIADYAISLVSSRTFGGHILVVTADRVAIADSLDERVGLTVEAEDVHMLAMFDRGALSHDLYSSSIDHGVFGALRTVDNTPFTIVVEMPYDDVFRSVGAVKKLVLLAVVVAMLASIVLGIGSEHAELVVTANRCSPESANRATTSPGSEAAPVVSTNASAAGVGSRARIASTSRPRSPRRITTCASWRPSVSPARSSTPRAMNLRPPSRSHRSDSTRTAGSPSRANRPRHSSVATASGNRAAASSNAAAVMGSSTLHPVAMVAPMPASARYVHTSCRYPFALPPSITSSRSMLASHRAAIIEASRRARRAAG